MFVSLLQLGRGFRLGEILTSYRNEEGKPRTKVHFNLTGLPDHVINAIEMSLKNGASHSDITTKGLLQNKNLIYCDTPKGLRFTIYA